MKKIILLMALVCGTAVPQAGAQRFAVKAYGDVGLGKAMSADHRPDRDDGQINF